MYREKVLFSFKNRFYSEENYILFRNNIIEDDVSENQSSFGRLANLSLQERFVNRVSVVKKEATPKKKQK